MKLILGSQSPRRRDLLLGMLPSEYLEVRPPRSSDEPGFDGLHTEAEIEGRLKRVVQLKLDDVVGQDPTSQVESGLNTSSAVICADTIVVASKDAKLVVLGKPPEDNWQQVTKKWFQQCYAGQIHEVWTCCLLQHANRTHDFTVKTRVRMCNMDDWMIDAYLQTGESVGKAGGYGIQGHAATFVESIEGSLTNVIGLPMFEVLAALKRLQLLPCESAES